MQRIIACLLSTIVFFGYPFGEGYALTVMDEKGMKAAIEYGRSRTIAEVVANPEWSRKGQNELFAIFASPFYMIALKSAEAKSKNREFTVEEAKAILDKGTSQPKTLGALDTLVFFTVASGASKETCQGFDAEVRQGERRLEPVQKDVELPTKNPTGIYYALYRLYFPLAKLDATGPVTLVMRSPLGEEWSYEFDLGKSR